MLRQCLVIVAALTCVSTAQAATYTIEKGSDIVGKVQSYTVQKGDKFDEIARKYDLGILELQEANPKINPNKALVEGTQLVIPTQFILPTGVAHEGIVLNLAEMRIYYFPPNNTDTVMTFPVGLGKQGWRTPVGQTTIDQKRANPIWIPPDAIREEAAEEGHELPDYVPAGPHNPLGLFAMNLGWSGYRIHGTNAPSSIGLRSSHGCIRLLPEDIDTLFHSVDVGTKVTVIHEPFKVGMMNGQLYFEAHKPFFDYVQNENSDQLVKDEFVNTQTVDNSKVNWSEVRKLTNETYGYPVKITNVPNAGN
jgi:L,D-transpeptidase ErfK/SrfK